MTTDRVRAYTSEIAFWHDVDTRAILSKSRSPSVCLARGDVMQRLRRDGFSTVQIGRWLGRDHSTVVHWTAGSRLSTTSGLDRLNGVGA